MNNLIFFGIAIILCAVVARYASRWLQAIRRRRAQRQELVKYRKEKIRKAQEADTKWFYGDDDEQ